ncbi:hypothetical protein I4U23_012630 [Adineta vaga]|nr:hypothetical protein I4U23_012630 [Adineta vaga]
MKFVLLLLYLLNRFSILIRHIYACINSKTVYNKCDIAKKNPVLFGIVWFTRNVKINDRIESIGKLREIVNHLEIFDNIDTFQQYIDQLSKNDRLILVLSDVKNIQIIRLIHHLRQISSIYLFCTDKFEKQQWINDFNKVKGIFHDLDELMTRIKKDQEIQKQLEEPLEIRVFTVTDYEDGSTTSLNGKFFYAQLLLEYILSIESNEQDRNELISLLKQEYSESPTELSKIDDFEKNYSCENVLKCLQRDVASFYMDDGNSQDNLVKILFEISAKPHRNEKTLFSNISLHSDFDIEMEVLFAPGCIFRLNDINCDKNQIWTIRMTLCIDDEHDLKLVFNQLKLQNEMQPKDLQTLAEFLVKMGKFDPAEKYFYRSIKQLPPGHPSLLRVYRGLADIASQTGDLDRSLQWQKKLVSLQRTISNTMTISNSEHIESNVSAVVKKRRVYPNGDVYEGELMNGLYHGYGVYVWKNHDRYEGMWQNNRREGQGTWIWGEQTSSAGDRYCGEWSLDKKHGNGEYFQAHGDVYRGQFKEDQRHGTGIYKTKDGQCFYVVYDHDNTVSREVIK